MDLQLKGKRAIVTGASRGIGRAIGDALAREGASIAICARGQAGIDEAVSAFQAAGAKAYGEATDVRDSKKFAGWFGRAVEQLGGLDVLISNVSTRVEGSGDQWWRDTFEADLQQHVRAFELAVPQLKQSASPAVVFVSSIASTLTQLPPYEVAYGAMKAALTSFAGQMAVVHGKHGIRVNLVAPGPIDFEGGFWDDVKQAQPAIFDRAASLSALGRMGRPHEVANAAVFLASPAASYITGANLRIDGGLLRTANF
ncbi:SDR family oxidoreductase [Sphingomonas sp. BN140010]|uniref:SDR family oxidoreductase n=1 Tax=Sphingomonas arvum TaxID=2992113 RepID=A0ABT3JCV2_9SPHN|nr:SDR family oxidoreductase [Sphingomonas sp. BN140010]MCW3796905.1 SDR family oxidoreductase [Sphingomonas sp. BN140010]